MKSLIECKEYLDSVHVSLLESDRMDKWLDRKIKQIKEDLQAISEYIEYSYYDDQTVPEFDTTIAESKLNQMLEEDFCPDCLEWPCQCDSLEETTSSGSIGTVVSGGKNAGTLFGGSYQQRKKPKKGKKE